MRIIQNGDRNETCATPKQRIKYYEYDIKVPKDKIGQSQSEKKQPKKEINDDDDDYIPIGMINMSYVDSGRKRM